MKTNKIFCILVSCLFSAAVVSCSNVPDEKQMQVQTAFAETIISQITETFQALPTNTETPSPEPTLTFTVAPTDTISVPVSQDTATSAVVNPYKAEVIGVFPSPNQFTPGQTFVLSWQIKNTGTAVWSGKYSFKHTDGIQLASSDSAPISDVIEPGNVLTLSLNAAAPTDYGDYKTTWTLYTPEGIPFFYVYYNLTVGDKSYITSLPSVSTITPTPNGTMTPSSLQWMCGDLERSKIQGSGCEQFCNSYGYSLRSSNEDCYVNGNLVN